MHYKPIEASVKGSSIPLYLQGAIYSAEKTKAPLTAVLFEQFDAGAFPTFRDELKIVLGRTNGRARGDTHLYFREDDTKTLLLLACDRDHAEEIFDQYFAKLGSQNFALAGFMHEYVPTPLAPNECEDHNFIRSKTDRFYSELTKGLEEVKEKCIPQVRRNLENLVAGERAELIRE